VLQDNSLPEDDTDTLKIKEIKEDFKPSGILKSYNEELKANKIKYYEKKI
jgi:hypothetical protein